MDKRAGAQADCFIAGSLAYRDGGEVKPAVDVEVRLMKEGKLTTLSATDFSGDFRIGRIAKNSGVYELVCVFDGYEPIRREVTVGEESPCLEVMIFS